MKTILMKMTCAGSSGQFIKSMSYLVDDATAEEFVRIGYADLVENATNEVSVNPKDKKTNKREPSASLETHSEIKVKPTNEKAK